MHGFPEPIINVGSSNLNGALGIRPPGTERKVLFTEAVTLTPSANLILPHGGPFITEVNDLAVFVSQGAGVWHSISYSYARSQTWQNVTGSRTYGTDYTNSTGRPIAASIKLSCNNTTPTLSFLVDGLTLTDTNNQNSGTGQSLNVFSIVPPGSVYRLNGSSGLVGWHELR